MTDKSLIVFFINCIYIYIKIIIFKYSVYNYHINIFNNNNMFILLYIINFINIIPNLNPNVVPKPGNIYQKKLHIPIIGKQIIEAEVITNNYAFIRLQELINEKGTLKYINKNDKYIIQFSYNLRKIIKKYKTELTFPYYDIENDEILFNLNVKVINYNTKIKMSRIN